MQNQTLMQAFEWYLPSDHQHWNRLAQLAPELAAKGIRKIWLPPAFKGTNKDDVGYMRARGVHTFLIGETFMRADDIEAEVRKLF